MKRIILSIFFCLLMIGVSGQGLENFTKAVDFLPPPPNAAAIVKHNQLTINKNTGSPAISIPLYPIRGIKLQLGISLKYSSTGIKVDEIASRVGIGWSIEAGGVVTRTVRGNPDELNPRLTPPAVFTNTNQTYYYLKDAVKGTPFGDTEPDVFNFSMNGLSGSFVLDNNMQPQVLTGQRYKVETDLVAGTVWNVKITDTEGIIYYFGGTGAVEKTKRESMCGNRDHGQSIPVSWYLKKVQHPNGEIITLNYSPLNYTYDTGVSEVQQWRYLVPADPNLSTTGTNSAYSCPSCTPVPRTQCVTYVNTTGVLLTGITSATGQALTITYGDREDCNDKIMAAFQYSGPGGNMVRYNFNYVYQASNSSYNNLSFYLPGYNKTAYLEGLEEYSSTNTLVNKHLFFYNDRANRPSRLSFSQDHWGYFNGVLNSNSLIPRPSTAELTGQFPEATANRQPDDKYAQKGLLSQIIYPTGGMDDLVYEGNTLAVSATTPYHVLYAQATGTGYKETVTQTVTFTVPFLQKVNLEMKCNSNGTYTVDPVHHLASFSLTGPSTNYSNTLPVDQQFTQYLDLPAGTYTFVVRANGDNVTTNANVRYQALAPSSQNQVDQLVGGLRVKAILTTAPGKPAEVRRFQYGTLATMNLSSLAGFRQPVYVTDTKSALSCQFTFGPGQVSSPITGVCYGKAMYSNSLNNLFDFSGSPISYQSVIESLGDNMEGGAIQSVFSTQADAPGQVTLGHDILNAPFSNFSNFYNGKAKDEITLKKTVSGTLIPVKSQHYTYRIDPSEAHIVSGYTVQEEYVNVQSIAAGAPPQDLIASNLISPFNVVRYDMMSAWVYNDRLTVTTFDKNGLNPITDTTDYEYSNPLHRQLTATITHGTGGVTRKEQLQYPHDYSSIAPYTDMVGKNIISPVVNVSRFKGSTKLTEIKMNYADWLNGNYALANVQSAYNNGAFVTDGTIDLYNTAGNIKQYKGKSGVPTAIIWGGPYGQYPVAKVEGATYAQAVAYLTVTESALNTSDETVIKTQVDKIRTGLPAAKVTTFTYKQKTGVSSITDLRNTITTFIFDSKDRFATQLDRSGYIEEKYDYNFGIPQAGTASVFYNNGVNGNFTCQSCAATYTGSLVYYSIPGGTVFSTVSVADATAKANLLLQAQGQAYANQYGSCTKNAPVYWNTLQTRTLAKNNCPVNYTAGTATYQVPAHTYSATTLEYANILAVNDLELNAQTWVNNNASCTSNCIPANCTSEGTKCVNGFCETGAKIIESSVQIHASVWQCTYHYQWSDNSVSGTYTGTSSSPCIGTGVE